MKSQKIPENLRVTEVLRNMGIDPCLMKTPRNMIKGSKCMKTPKTLKMYENTWEWVKLREMTQNTCKCAENISTFTETSEMTQISQSDSSERSFDTNRSSHAEKLCQDLDAFAFSHFYCIFFYTRFFYRWRSQDRNAHAPRSHFCPPWGVIDFQCYL